MFPVVFSTTLIEQSRVFGSATVQTILIIAGLTNLADIGRAVQNYCQAGSGNCDEIFATCREIARRGHESSS